MVRTQADCTYSNACVSAERSSNCVRGAGASLVKFADVADEAMSAVLIGNVFPQLVGLSAVGLTSGGGVVSFWLSFLNVKSVSSSQVGYTRQVRLQHGTNLLGLDRRTKEVRGGPGFFLTCWYSQTHPLIWHKEHDGLSRLPKQTLDTSDNVVRTANISSSS